MKISSKHYDSDWRNLKLDDPESPDWDGAIEIFKDRIVERFIVPINALIEYERSRQPSERRCGFVIMAIDCLLIETLQAFRWGKLLSEYNPAETSLIVKFLQKSPRFYWEDWKAYRFCRDFRNGILHQAETKNDSLIRSDGPLVTGDENDKGLIINRTKFHEQVEGAFSDYLNELGEESKTELRSNFRKKMDEVCRENQLEKDHPRKS
jgi:hypothetical protein